MWRVVDGREGDEKGGVSVEMLDGQRHDVGWVVVIRSRAFTLRLDIASHLKLQKKKDKNRGSRWDWC